MKRRVLTLKFLLNIERVEIAIKPFNIILYNPFGYYKIFLTIQDTLYLL